MPTVFADIQHRRTPEGSTGTTKQRLRNFEYKLGSVEPVAKRMKET
jgi:hypothetical protein